jgi:hypothetical protein
MSEKFSISPDAVLAGAFRADLVSVVVVGEDRAGKRYVAAEGEAEDAVKALKAAEKWIKAGCP